MYKHFFKRVIDFVLSLIGGIVLLPIFLIISLAIVIDDPGPVIFKQKRVGKGKKLFWLHKFRSMKVNTPDIPTHLLEHPEQYITKVGKFLRQDELGRAAAGVRHFVRKNEYHRAEACALEPR